MSDKIVVYSFKSSPEPIIYDNTLHMYKYAIEDFVVFKIIVNIIYYFIGRYPM